MVDREDKVAPQFHEMMGATETQTNVHRQKWSTFFRRPFLSRYVLLGIFIILLIHMLVFAESILIPIVLSLFLCLLLQPVIRFLERFHIPSKIGAALVVLVLIGGVSIVSLPLIGPAQEWISNAPQRLSKIEQKIHDLLVPVDQVRRVVDEIGKLTTPQETSEGEVRLKEQSFANQLLASTQTIVGYAIVVTILLYFLLASGDKVWTTLTVRSSQGTNNTPLLRTIHDIERRLSRYFYTVTIINICVGTIIGLIMFIIGLPNPVLWGALAGLLNYIPYIGPLIGEIIIGMVGLFTFDSIGHILLGPLFYLVFTFIEGNFVTPMILGSRFVLNPIFIILSMMFWGWVWGIIGLFLSVPLLMLSMIVYENISSLPSNGMPEVRRKT